MYLIVFKDARLKTMHFSDHRYALHNAGIFFFSVVSLKYMRETSEALKRMSNFDVGAQFQILA